MGQAVGAPERSGFVTWISKVKDTRSKMDILMINSEVCEF